MPSLEKALRWIVLGGIFLLPIVPLIVTTSLFFPYITGKNFMFRIVVEVISAAWIGLALVDPKYRPRRSWILAAFGIFIVLIAIADAQGVNPFKSFWSNYERMDGWVTIAHLFAYLVVASSVLRVERLWNWLWWTTLTVSFLSSVYGLLQVIGYTSLGQGGSAGLSARIDTTFGNPIYLAVYMLFHIFIAAMLWIRSWQEKSEYRVAAAWGYGVVIVLDTLALFLTGTRGTMLGLIGGAILTVLILAVFGQSKRIRWVAVAAVALVILLGGALKLGKDTSFVKSVGFLDRLASISASDTTIASRFINMSIAWKGVKERPLFGWGQENYAVVFDKYYDSRMYADEPWFDRVHDIIFDWWVAGGTLGLLAYLSIFVATLWALWRPNGGFTLQERAVLTGLLAGYFVHNLTVFDNVTSYILFGTVLAYIVYRSTEARESAVIPQRAFLSTEQLPYTALLALLIAGALVWFVNANAYRANRALIQAIAPQSNVTDNLDLFNKALSYNSLGQQEIREQLIQGAAQIASQSGGDDVKQQFFQLAASQMIEQEKVSPLDARFPLFLGILYDAYGDHTKAAAALQKAHELSPAKQEIDFQVAQNAWLRGDNQAALQITKTAYDEAPAFGDAQVYYAAAAIRAKNSVLAGQLLEPLIASDRAADPRILAAYVAAGELTQAIPLWQAHLKNNPQDAQAYFTLAAIYYQLGQKSPAISVLQAAAAQIPDIASQAQSAIESIKNGTANVQ